MAPKCISGLAPKWVTTLFERSLEKRLARSYRSRVKGLGSRHAIIGLVLFGMLVGAAAQLILGRSRKGIDWALAFGCGLAGSFVGGLIVSLLAGDGLELRPSGLIGSLVGAIVVTAAWQWWRGRANAKA